MWVLAALLLSASPQADHSPATSKKQCQYDPHIMDMGFEAFDQNMTGGWRALADKKGCEAEAAEIIGEYRSKYQSMIPVLYWHEAQIRAMIGEKAEAVVLMRHSRKPEGNGDLDGWNSYVDATIAFLQNDRHRFLIARDRLAGFKRPADWPKDAEWPQNASVVAGLWNCFGKPYETAYSASCRPTIQRPH